MAGRNAAVDALREQVTDRRPDGLHYCSANGCLLAGTWSTNTREGGPWWCFVHSASEGKDMGEVTRRVNERGWLVSLIFWINSMGVLDFDERGWRIKLAARLEKINRPELSPLADIGNGRPESRTRYIARLRRQMIEECTEGVRDFIKVSESSGGDAWAQLDRSFKAIVGAA